MKKYYFTFGSWVKFPYQNTYLIVMASSYSNAVKGFREKHPDVNPGCMNCSDCYTEEQWERVGKLYADRNPAEIIWTEKCFGKIIPKGYDDLFIYVPDMKQIVRITEGTGDNFPPEGQGKGDVDYIYYEQYGLGQDMPKIGSGRVMYKKTLRDQYQCMADSIQDVLKMAYGSPLVDCMVLA